MKKKYTETPLVDEYLKSISGIQPAEIDPFFYTRLKAKMDKKLVDNPFLPNFKWAFVIGTLAVLLTINCWILSQPHTPQTPQNAGAPQQNFAEVYAIGNSPSY